MSIVSLLGVEGKGVNSRHSICPRREHLLVGKIVVMIECDDECLGKDIQGAQFRLNREI